MNLDRAGQAALLKLSEIDLEITRLRTNIEKAINSSELIELEKQLADGASELIEARSQVENLQAQVKRSEEDIRLVVERLVRDRERLNATSSAKDAIGIQSEIDSLERRKTELEEVELGLLEELESAQAAFAEIESTRGSIQDSIQSLRDSIQSSVDQMKAEGRKLSADRSVVVTNISAEVLAKYDNLSKRQIAVGQIVDRACSACRMTLTVGAIDALSAVAEDEIGNCPECQAMIVR